MMEANRQPSAVSRQLEKLISELEKAKEGSRELSDEVLLMCGWSYRPNRYGPGGPQWGGGGLWTNPLGIGTAASDSRPSPTESLDAALPLVPERCWAEGTLGSPSYIEIHNPKIYAEIGKGEGATPALALCIAALKARLMAES